MNPALPRSIAWLPYAAARLPFTLLEDFVVTRYWDHNAPVRVGFERWLGSVDLVAGRLLADDEISRRGQALMQPQTPATEVNAVEVTFTLPADLRAETVTLCGEFNDWSADDTRLERGSDGSWQATVALKPGRSYRYRYLLDGQRWENDEQADGYVPNPLGSVDSVVVVE